MTGQPGDEQDVLADVVQRIVRIAAPEQIVLFGSTARGEANADSDFDLLVVKSGQYHRRRLAKEIYRGMIGAGPAVDVVVVTPEDIERYGNSEALVNAPAFRQGRVIYAT
jgi:predicted nucleotidyltransferase